MKEIKHIYINNKLIMPHRTEKLDLFSPVTNAKVATVCLGDEHDVDLAVAAAKEAFSWYRETTKEERIVYLQRLHKVVSKREDELASIMVEEYGAPLPFCKASAQHASSAFLNMIETLRNFDLEKTVGVSKVILEPLGVVGIITPWNASNGFICNKVATALAAGCTTVIKPSELSAQQTQLIIECFQAADLPDGLINIVNGTGTVVGNAITAHRDIAKISFTGSTLVGKAIAKGAVDTMKRVTLELGGKSPNIILDDADFDKVIPMAVQMAYMNSGQACIAPTRLLVPENRLAEVNKLAIEAAKNIRVGDPKDAATQVGPMVTQKQFERVQDFIRIGRAEGATLLIGGEGKPEGLEKGNFVKATIFSRVTNDMRIAQEEIFGPVLCIISYKDELEAISIANDTTYGLAAYVSSADPLRANYVASKITAGRISINKFGHDSHAPFGGFKQSGIGREFGVYGLEEYLEPKTILE